MVGGVGAVAGEVGEEGSDVVGGSLAGAGVFCGRSTIGYRWSEVLTPFWCACNAILTAKIARGALCYRRCSGRFWWISKACG